MWHWVIKKHHSNADSKGLPVCFLNLHLDCGVWFLFPSMDQKHLAAATVTHTCTAASMLRFHPTACPTFWAIPGLQSDCKANAHLRSTCPQSPQNTRRPETYSLLTFWPTTLFFSLCVFYHCYLTSVLVFLKPSKTWQTEVSSDSVQ